MQPFCTLLGITAGQGSLLDGPLHPEVGNPGEAGGVLGRGQPSPDRVEDSGEQELIVQGDAHVPWFMEG